MTVSLSTQTLILAVVSLLFISVSVLCEFSMLPDVYIFLSPQEEEVHSSTWGNKCAHLVVHSWKRLKEMCYSFKKWPLNPSWISNKTIWKLEMLQKLLLLKAFFTLVIKIHNYFFVTVSSDIFMRQTLTNDFWVLHENINCVFPLNRFSIIILLCLSNRKTRLQNKLLRHWSSYCRLSTVIDEFGPFQQELHQTSTLRGSIIQYKQGILCYDGCYDTK